MASWQAMIMRCVLLKLTVNSGISVQLFLLHFRYTVWKSLISLYFASKEPELSFKVAFSTFFGFLRVFRVFLWLFFHSFLVQKLIRVHFQGIFLGVLLLSHLALTYESFKPKKAPNSKAEAVLGLHISDKWAKSSF